MNHQVVVLLFAAQLALASGQQGTKLKPSSLLQKQVQVRAKQHLQVSDEEADAGVHAKYLRNALVMVKELASNVTEWDTNLSKSEREALDLIKDFIDDLSKSAIKSHDVDQREVNRAKGLIADCAISAETSLTDDVAPLKTRMHGSRKNHNACRTKEADCQSKEHDRCDKWDLYRKNTELSACADVNFHEHKKSDVPATKAAMEKCLLDLQPFYLKYKDCSKYGECVTEIAPVCDTNQTQFEKDFCIYHKLLNTTCQAQTDCREKHIAFRDATHGDVRANEAFRKADHITSQMVLCYFKVFESNNTNKSAILRGNNTNKSAILRGCEQLAVNTSQLDINYPAIPDAHDCDVEPRQPCDKDWLSAEYDSKMWKGNVTMLDCRPCPQACNPGFYNDGSMDSCEFCAGVVNAARTKCELCTPGRHHHKASSSCLDCSPGRYSAELGSTECSSCSAGKYQPESRQTTCIKCPSGYHSPSSGASTCTKCPEGSGGAAVACRFQSTWTTLASSACFAARDRNGVSFDACSVKGGNCKTIHGIKLDYVRGGVRPSGWEGPTHWGNPSGKIAAIIADESYNIIYPQGKGWWYSLPPFNSSSQELVFVGDYSPSRQPLRLLYGDSITAPHDNSGSTCARISVLFSVT